MNEDGDAPALLEWISAVNATSKPIRSIEELGDGEVLLRIMRDLSPGRFLPADADACRPQASHLLQLLEGLEEHLRGRGESNRTCEFLLAQARNGDLVDPALLAKLVLVATVENELPRRDFYVEAMFHLSHETQTIVQAILQRFLSGAGLESPTKPHQRTRPGGSPLYSESSPSFTPPNRMVSAASPGDRLPDFREAGLDLETRFRRLEQHYHVAMDTQERLLEEKTALKRNLEAEQTRRRELEQLERTMRMDLREAEEARDRAREEQRSSFESRLDTEMGNCKARLVQKDEELEVMREEFGLARGQAAGAEKLSNQLELFKQKLEESQAFRHENVELRAQIEELLNKGDNAAGEHLHRSLARSRESASRAAIERDEAQRQVELLREELSREQEALRKHRGLLGSAHLDSCGAAGGAAAGAAAGGGRILALEATAAILAASAADVEQPARPPLHRTASGNVEEPAGGAEELRLLRAQKDEMLERLLSEKERAARAESIAQAKSAEVAVLSEQKASLAKQIALLEAQIEEHRGRADVGGGQESSTAAEDAETLQELQSKLALRERELQVHQMRGSAEKTSLAAQESLMTSCFHELGLRYQRLKLENDRLQQHLRDRPSSD